jgi:hypothetical protein
MKKIILRTVAVAAFAFPVVASATVPKGCILVPPSGVLCCPTPSNPYCGLDLKSQPLSLIMHPELF